MARVRTAKSSCHSMRDLWASESSCLLKREYPSSQALILLSRTENVVVVVVVVVVFVTGGMTGGVLAGVKETAAIVGDGCAASVAIGSFRYDGVCCSICDHWGRCGFGRLEAVGGGIPPLTGGAELADTALWWLTGADCVPPSTTGGAAPVNPLAVLAAFVEAGQYLSDQGDGVYLRRLCLLGST
jgi:hypothetical protein